MSDPFDLWRVKNPLKKLRDGMNRTQSDMAAFLGVSIVSYRAWEFGDSAPNLENQGAVGKLLKMSQEEFGSLWQRWYDSKPKKLTPNVEV